MKKPKDKTLGYAVIHNPDAPTMFVPMVIRVTAMTYDKETAQMNRVYGYYTDYSTNDPVPSRTQHSAKMVARIFKSDRAAEAFCTRLWNLINLAIAKLGYLTMQKELALKDLRVETDRLIARHPDKEK